MYRRCRLTQSHLSRLLYYSEGGDASANDDPETDGQGGSSFINRNGTATNYESGDKPQQHYTLFLTVSQ